MGSLRLSTSLPYVYDIPGLKSPAHTVAPAQSSLLPIKTTDPSLLDHYKFPFRLYFNSLVAWTAQIFYSTTTPYVAYCLHYGRPAIEPIVNRPVKIIKYFVTHTNTPHAPHGTTPSRTRRLPCLVTSAPSACDAVIEYDVRPGRYHEDPFLPRI